VPGANKSIIAQMIGRYRLDQSTGLIAAIRAEQQRRNSGFSQLRNAHELFSEETIMGLLDILNGMQSGSRQSQQSGTGGGGMMSPIAMALLGILAQKALQSFAGSQSASPGSTGQPPSRSEGGTTMAAGSEGGLADILGGLLGGKPTGLPAQGQPGASLNELLPSGLRNALGGAAAGNVLSGGLNELIKGFQDSGHGKVAQSWVGKGQNQAIAPNDLAAALGGDTLDALTKQTGLNRQDLLSGLTQQLPRFVDQLTPDGRLPTDQEASQMV
jgi:uncharacterized protein YidB (DUF937 family)